MAVAPRQYTDSTSVDSSRTLGRKLIATADMLRDQFTRFGLRPFKMRVVRVRWSGGHRGVGTAVIECTQDILPTPRIMDMAGLTEIVHPIGLDEDGAIMVTEISGRFSDEDLRFARSDGAPLGPDEEVWYEIEFPRTDGKPGDLRRFFLRAAPMYYADRFQWNLRLEKAHSDRARNGDYR